MNVTVTSVFKAGWGARITDAKVPKFAGISKVEIKAGCIVPSCNKGAKKMKHGFFCEKHYWLSTPKVKHA